MQLEIGIGNGGGCHPALGHEVSSRVRRALTLTPPLAQEQWREGGLRRDEDRDDDNVQQPVTHARPPDAVLPAKAGSHISLFVASAFRRKSTGDYTPACPNP